jgi:hypothetical protein
MTKLHKARLVRAMMAAGYNIDTDSTDDDLRFTYDGMVTPMRMGSWGEVEEWLNGVVFDDPKVADEVRLILGEQDTPPSRTLELTIRLCEYGPGFEIDCYEPESGDSIQLWGQALDASDLLDSLCEEVMGWVDLLNEEVDDTIKEVRA